MSLTSGMDLEAGATGKDIAEVQGAPLTKRLITAPIGLIVAEVGAQAGVFVEDQLASFLMGSDKKGKADNSWRGKVLVGKVLLAVLLYPVSVPQYQLQQFSEVMANENTATHKSGGLRQGKQRAASYGGCKPGRTTL